MRRADKSIGRLSILKRSLANAVSLDWKVFSACTGYADETLAIA